MVNKYMTERFNARKAINDIVDWIKHYFAENGPTSKAVIGISGGKDSTIAATLLTKALGPDRVLGVLMPNAFQRDITYANDVVEMLGIPSVEINIEDTFNAITESIPKDMFGCDNQEIYYTNTPARIRMTTLYAIAGLCGGRVVNTCNFSEDYVGYSTKFGDNAGDFSILSNYTVTEILAIGDELKLPKRYVYKTPEDGMSGKSDEDKLGITYFDLDNYILNGIVPNAETLARIMSLWEHSRHKAKYMPTAPNNTRRYYVNPQPDDSRRGDWAF